jgi:isoquinoline 1-oxidoreductase alpha subunit
MTRFAVNGRPVEIEADDETALLWALRDHLGLTGTKYGCGGGYCGACTVHLDDKPVRACRVPLSAVAGANVRTIEGLSADGSHPLQQAWIAEQVPQCGYCQSGQIMQAAALLEKNPDPSRDEIVRHMDGIICRCGTYTRIIAAIRRAAQVA